MKLSSGDPGAIRTRDPQIRKRTRTADLQAKYCKLSENTITSNQTVSVGSANHHFGKNGDRFYGDPPKKIAAPALNGGGQFSLQIACQLFEQQYQKYSLASITEAALRRENRESCGGAE